MNQRIELAPLALLGAGALLALAAICHWGDAIDRWPEAPVASASHGAPGVPAASIPYGPQGTSVTTYTTTPYGTFKTTFGPMWKIDDNHWPQAYREEAARAWERELDQGRADLERGERQVGR